jgi:hypothetical protein
LQAPNAGINGGPDPLSATCSDIDGGSNLATSGSDGVPRWPSVQPPTNVDFAGDCRQSDGRGNSGDMSVVGARVTMYQYERLLAVQSMAVQLEISRGFHRILKRAAAALPVLTRRATCVRVRGLIGFGQQKPSEATPRATEPHCEGVVPLRPASAAELRAHQAFVKRRGFGSAALDRTAWRKAHLLCVARSGWFCVASWRCDIEHSDALVVRSSVAPRRSTGGRPRTN